MEYFFNFYFEIVYLFLRCIDLFGRMGEGGGAEEEEESVFSRLPTEQEA